ncbi:YafY family protein [Vallitalea sediminicola]
MQIDRLFQIVYLLLDKKQVTAKELSNILEVSTRTIYRDVETLSMAGIPIYTNKGKGGGISLLDNFIINKSVLSNEEQNKVLIGLELLKATEYENVDDAILKLKSLFKKSNENWIEVDFSYWGSSKSEKKKFEDLKYALTFCRSIRFAYYNLYGDKTTRIVNPLKLIFKQKDWYLLGYCLMRKDYRMFKIYRMKNLEITSSDFDRDDYNLDDFNLSYQQTAQLISLKIILAPEIKYRAYNEFNINDIICREDGSYEIMFKAVEDEWLYNYIITFGQYIKIIEPSYINDIIKKKLEDILRSYQ